jgi:hypothetical protein
VCVIDSEEYALFHAERLVDASVWAVRYEAAVTTTEGDSWFGMATIANRADKAPSPAPLAAQEAPWKRAESPRVTAP